MLRIGVGGSEVGGIGAKGSEGAGGQVSSQALWVEAGAAVSQRSVAECAEMGVTCGGRVLFQVRCDGLRTSGVEVECCGCRCWKELRHLVRCYETVPDGWRECAKSAEGRSALQDGLHLVMKKRARRIC